METPESINWTAAVLGAAVLGGIVYGILSRGFQISEPIEGVGGGVVLLITYAAAQSV
jgi:hypothetical protein